MTAFRLISLPTHAVLELVVGFAVMASPFALGFGPAGLVSAFVIGALIVGLALTSDGIGIAAHFAFDRGIAIGLLGGALVLGLAGDRAASAFFAVAAVAQLALNVTTRYSAR